MYIGLIVGVICGVICAVIADSKGRSAIGWFFIGFLFGLIGLVVSICMSNVKEQEEKEAAMLREQKRLKERIKQEQIRNSTFQNHVERRLDSHDRALGIETRDTAALETNTTRNVLEANTKDPLLDDINENGWYFLLNDERQGPVSRTVVRELIQAETLRRDTLILRPGMNDWEPAHAIAELA